MTLVVNIIGAGHLGKTIGYLLAKQPELVRIGAICNTSKKSTDDAIAFIGGGVYCAEIRALPSANITVIATPDDVIAEVCAALADNPWLKPGDIVMHCSGALSSDALYSVAAKGCFTASVHPMRSFANPAISVTRYQGTYCAIEGDREAMSVLTSLFEAIGSVTYAIDKRKKSLYHAAGVFSSNYLITLAQQALVCMQEAGVDKDMAMHVIVDLMKGSVVNLETTLSPECALTGPIQRGDIATIKKHGEALQHVEQKMLYAALGKATLALTQHDVRAQRDIEAAMEWNV